MMDNSNIPHTGPQAAAQDNACHDPAQETTTSPRSAWQHIFAILAFQPLIPLTLLLILQTLFLLDARALWYSDEVRYANVFEHLAHGGKWIVLHLNGVPYPDKPPVYFWLLAGVQYVLNTLGISGTAPGIIEPRLFFAGAAVSGVLYLWATYFMARSVAKVDKHVALGAGLVLLSIFYFIGITHYSRMDLLFGALITISHVCLFKGWQKKEAPFWIISGFILAALATLTKGPLGLAFPIVTSVFFLFWRGTPGRLGARDVAYGFGTMLLILLSWVMAAYLTEHPDFLRNIFQDQIYRRATDTWHHAQPWWHYLVALPAAWLPWTLVLCVLPISRLFSKNTYKTIIASRKPENEGMAYLWIALISGIGILSAVSIKIVIYLVPLFAPLAILTAYTVLALPDTRVKRFIHLLALLLASFAVVLITLQLGQTFQWQTIMQAVRWPLALEGLWPLAAGCILGAILLWSAAPRAGGRGALLMAVLFCTAWIQPLGLITAPSLDRVMSPRSQGLLMGEYIQKGYTPITYKVYSGTYAYYAKSNILEFDQWPDLDAAMAQYSRVVVAMRSKHWNTWANKPGDIQQISQQWIADQEYIVAVRTTGAQTTDRPKPTAPTSEPSASDSEAQSATPLPKEAGEQTEPALPEQHKQPQADSALPAPAPGTENPAPAVPTSEPSASGPEPQSATPLPKEAGEQTEPALPEQHKQPQADSALPAPAPGTENPAPAVPLIQETSASVTTVQGIENT